MVNKEIGEIKNIPNFINKAKDKRKKVIYKTFTGKYRRRIKNRKEKQSRKIMKSQSAQLTDRIYFIIGTNQRHLPALGRPEPLQKSFLNDFTFR